MGRLTDMLPVLVALAAVPIHGTAATGKPVTVNVRLDREAGAASPLIYGCSLPAPGTPGARALLPELVRNGSFEAPPQGIPLVLPERWGDAPGWDFQARGEKQVIVRTGLGRGQPLLIMQDKKWPPHRITLFLRKLDGPGGIRVLFGLRHAEDCVRWTLGAQHNRYHLLERVDDGDEQSLGPAVPGHLETGRVYRLHVVVQYDGVACMLDGRPIQGARANVLRHGGVGLAAEDATFECWGLKVTDEKGRLLYSLDDPEREGDPAVARHWQIVADDLDQARYWWNLLYPANGYFSQEIRALDAEGGVGIAQAGIPVEAGATYRLKLFLRSPQGVGAVVALRRADGTSCWREEVKGLEDVWAPREFEFTAPATDANASLCIFAAGRGSVHVDRVSLARADECTQFALRRGVMEALRALRPPVLRWPAGAGLTHYEWERGVGPRHERPPVPVSHGGADGFEFAPNDFGTDEFLALAEHVGARPILVTNPVLGLRPALYWLEYCNGSQRTRFGRRRADNGHPEPYGVGLVQIPSQGTEIDDAAYNITAAAQAIRQENPKVRVLAPAAIKLGAEEAHATVSARLGWQQAKGGMGFDALAKRLDTIREEGRPVAVADWAPGASPADAAVTAAKALNVLARHADVLAMATCRGVVPEAGAASRGAVFGASNGSVAPSSVWAVLKLFRAHAVDELFETAVDASGQRSSGLDVLAGRAGEAVVVRVVHNAARPTASWICFLGRSAQRLADTARVFHLAGEQGGAPQASEIAVADGAFPLDFPPHSVTVLVVPLKEKWDGLLDRF
jgi:alpha-N-arabinofuranosidase